MRPNFAGREPEFEKYTIPQLRDGSNTMPQNATRRRVIQATAGVSTVLIAGCTDSGSDDGGSSGDDGSMEEENGSMDGDDESMDDGG